MACLKAGDGKGGGVGVSSIGLQCSVGEHELHVDDGIGDAHEGSVTKSLARHTWRARVHCVGDEVAEHGADHGGVGDVGEHTVAGDAHLQQQLLPNHKRMETALRARAAHAVHVVAEAEGADARAVVMTSDAQLLEGRYSPEETWQNLSLVVRFTVCENNNVYVFAGGVFQSKGKGELVGCNEVSGAFRSQAVDNCLRLKFPCAARENTARGCTERLHLPSAVISVLASFTLASELKDTMVTESSPPQTSTMTLEECLARSRRVKFTWLSCEEESAAACVAELSMEPDTSRTMMQWMGLRCGFSTASSACSERRNKPLGEGEGGCYLQA